MTQLRLFGHAPYQRHSKTSVDAANAIGPRLGQLQSEVLNFIRQAGVHGATDEEIQEGLTLNPSTQRPRRIELMYLGLIYNSSITRRTRSGRNATVWRYKRDLNKGEDNV